MPMDFLYFPASCNAIYNHRGLLIWHGGLPGDWRAIKFFAQTGVTTKP